LFFRQIFIDVYINKRLNILKIMGCGCKNKANQAQPTQQSASPQAQSTNNSSIQESIKKVVEKYYTKKK